METKLGPMEKIIGEIITGYKYTVVDPNKKLNDNLVLYFKSGKELFISSVVGANELKGTSVLFLGPGDLNETITDHE